MFIDFILLWSATVPVLKLGLKGLISPEQAAFILLVVLFTIVTLRVFGSTAFQERSRIPKFLCSLTIFSLSVADGDVDLAVSAAIWSMAPPVCLFGLYVMIRSAFGKI